MALEKQSYDVSPTVKDTPTLDLQQQKETTGFLKDSKDLETNLKKGVELEQNIKDTKAPEVFVSKIILNLPQDMQKYSSPAEFQDFGGGDGKFNFVIQGGGMYNITNVSTKPEVNGGFGDAGVNWTSHGDRGLRISGLIGGEKSSQTAEIGHANYINVSAVAQAGIGFRIPIGDGVKYDSGLMIQGNIGYKLSTRSEGINECIGPDPLHHIDTPFKNDRLTTNTKFYSVTIAFERDFNRKNMNSIAPFVSFQWGGKGDYLDANGTRINKTIANDVRIEAGIKISIW